MSALAALEGTALGPTAWRDVDQARIDAFAAATDDSQWIHTDAVRAAAESPFGTTVAHGFLTLALCAPLLTEVLPLGGRTLVNYGVDRVRFPAPLPAGARIRAVFQIVAVEASATGERLTLDATVEREGGERPVCVARLVMLVVA